MCCRSASLKYGVALVPYPATTKAAVFITLSEISPKWPPFDDTSQLE
jgi:hypothetical protein